MIVANWARERQRERRRLVVGGIKGASRPGSPSPLWHYGGLTEAPASGEAKWKEEEKEKFDKNCMARAHF